jgi:hypothetical protein
MELEQVLQVLREGYRSATAVSYKEQRDSSILNYGIFQQWISLVPRQAGPVVELGFFILKLFLLFFLVVFNSQAEPTKRK